MTFKRLKALYEAGANVHYKGELYRIKELSEIKQGAWIERVGGMFEPPIPAKASELD